MSPRTRRLAAPIAAFLFGLVALGVAAYVTLAPETPRRQASAAIGGPFALVDGEGRTVTETDFKGTPFLVFFGFTQCPNICPTTLADLGTLLDTFGAEGGDVQAYYITLDPERDTQAVMQEYMASFTDRITGLTGTPQQIERVARDYRASVKRVPLPGGDYTLEHTLMVYMMDRNGGFAGPLDLNAGHALALKQLRKLVSDGRST